MTQYLHAVGLANFHGPDVLDVWYPEPVLTQNPQSPDFSALREQLSAAEGYCEARQVKSQVIELSIEIASPPQDAADAYLRLHALSHCLVEPNQINLEGLFAKLQNVVWTNAGPCAVTDFEKTRLRLRLRDGVFPVVQSVDKFPPLLNYVIPASVRVGDAVRVRLGAHLAAGTTVMHEGFVNFNAGTLGTSMVEGRISQGVVVDDGSDVGGGASTMGTLSGGGKERVRLGRGCLLGAESGLGIALGDNCVVEAGLYVTAGMKVTLVEGESRRVVKARELSGLNDLLFIRNSQSGAVEARSRTGKRIELNADLHSN